MIFIHIEFRDVVDQTYSEVGEQCLAEADLVLEEPESLLVVRMPEEVDWNEGQTVAHANDAQKYSDAV